MCIAERFEQVPGIDLPASQSIKRQASGRFSETGSNLQTKQGSLTSDAGLMPDTPHCRCMVIFLEGAVQGIGQYEFNVSLLSGF